MVSGPVPVIWNTPSGYCQSCTPVYAVACIYMHEKQCSHQARVSVSLAVSTCVFPHEDITCIAAGNVWPMARMACTKQHRAFTIPRVQSYSHSAPAADMPRLQLLMHCWHCLLSFHVGGLCCSMLGSPDTTPAEHTSHILTSWYGKGCLCVPPLSTQTGFATSCCRSCLTVCMKLDLVLVKCLRPINNCILLELCTNKGSTQDAAF